MATKFTRHASGQLLSGLQKDPLFMQKLKADCMDEKLLMAIRKGVIHFYHQGGRLFEYDSGQAFKTHRKYAAVIDSDDYLTESQIGNLKISPTFMKDYEEMKQLCSKYSGPEAKGVSDIYHGNSYLNPAKNVVVLDIEASFESMDPNRQADRIDIVLYNKDNQKLTFVEAKYYSNTEIRAKKGKQARVVKQIKRYEDQIDKSRDEILDAYKGYISIINAVFNQNLPQPADVDKDVILLVFGFDNEQKNRLGSKEFRDPIKGIKAYFKGNPATLVPGNLLKRAKVI